MTGSIARALKHTHYHFYYAKQRRKIFQEGKNTKEEKDQDGRGGKSAVRVRSRPFVRPRRIASKYEKWNARGRGWKWRPRAADNWEVETADEVKVLFFIHIWESSIRCTIIDAEQKLVGGFKSPRILKCLTL